MLWFVVKTKLICVGCLPRFVQWGCDEETRRGDAWRWRDNVSEREKTKLHKRRVMAPTSLREVVAPGNREKKRCFWPAKVTSGSRSLMENIRCWIPITLASDLQYVSSLLAPWRRMKFSPQEAGSSHWLILGRYLMYLFDIMQMLYAPLQSNEWPVFPHSTYQYTPSIWLYSTGFVWTCVCGCSCLVGMCACVCVRM